MVINSWVEVTFSRPAKTCATILACVWHPRIPETHISRGLRIFLTTALIIAIRYFLASDHSSVLPESHMRCILWQSCTRAPEIASKHVGQLSHYTRSPSWAWVCYMQNHALLATRCWLPAPCPVCYWCVDSLGIYWDKCIHETEAFATSCLTLGKSPCPLWWSI